MRKRGLLLLVLLLGPALIQTGCYNVQLYEGPPRPAGEEAILFYWRKEGLLEIVRVDGERLALPPTGMFKTNFAQLHLLPGEHTIFVCPVWGLYRGVVAGSRGWTAVAWSWNWERSSPEQREAVWNSIDGWLVRFVVEPGRKYNLSADTTGASADHDARPGEGRAFDLEVVVLGSDTLTVERRLGWQNWIPYVRDDESGERVSEIVSGVSRGSAGGRPGGVLRE